MIQGIVIFSTADWDTKPWTNKQHMAMALAKRGYRVLYVDSTGIRRPGANKSDLSRMFRRISTGLRGIHQISANIYRFSPLVIPYHQCRLINTLNRFFLENMLKFFTRRLGLKEIVAWVYNPVSATALTRVKPKLIIYHCVDELSAIPGIQRNMIQEHERQLVEKAHLIFSTNPKLHERWLSVKPNSAYYLPNVADFVHFSRARTISNFPPEIARIPKPRIGYVGTLSDFKIDFKLVMAVSHKRPHWHWVMIGGEREGQQLAILQELKRRQNVHFLGYKDYADLPEFMAGMDVGALPMLKNAYTRCMFPMKFFEYLSAGLPVVATQLPALIEYEKAYLLARNSDEFIVAVEKIMKGDVPDQSYCTRLAALHTWDQRLDKMMRHIEDSLRKIV